MSITKAPVSGAILHSDTQQDLGWALGALFRAWRERAGHVLGALPHGPRGYQTMMAVIEGDHPSQLALARHLGLDRTVMTYLIDDLEAAGLVERRPNPDDRRLRQIVVTAHGHETLARLCTRVAAAESAILGALDPAERETLRHLLAKAATPLVDGTFDPCTVLPD